MTSVLWSNLPSELVIEIADHLLSCTDKLRLRSVCSAWRAALRHHPNHRPRSRVIPVDGGFNPVCHTDTNIHLISRTIFLLSPAPNPNSTHHHFNSRSLLIKTEEINHGRFRLVFPFTRFPCVPKSFPKLINLSDIRILELGHEYVLHHTCDRSKPSMKSHRFYEKKVVYLPVGNHDDFAVLTIHMTDKLAMFRSVDQQWENVDFMGWRFIDVVAFNGKFYAVDYAGKTLAISPDSGDIAPLITQRHSYGVNKHLVQMENELILVDCDNAINIVAPFTVFKLDMDGNKWVKIDDLGDRVLFLGGNSTFSASASDLKWYDTKGNYICYSNRDNFHKYSKLALRWVVAYDMKARMRCHRDHRYYSKLFWPFPSWITSSTP